MAAVMLRSYLRCSNQNPLYKPSDYLGRRGNQPIVFSQLKKVEDIQAIRGYGVMSMLGVVIDGSGMHAAECPTQQAGSAGISG